MFSEIQRWVNLADAIKIDGRSINIGIAKTPFRWRISRRADTMSNRQPDPNRHPHKAPDKPPDE